MAKLSGPYEIFDLNDGQEVEFKVTRFEVGDVDIHPGYGEAIKVVQAVRLYLDKPLFPMHLHYADVTSNRLRITLLEQLTRADFRTKTYKVKKFGVAPKALFQLEVSP